MSRSVALRVQALRQAEQVVVLARLAEGRSADGSFTGAAVETLFDELRLPRPARVRNVLGTLASKGDVVRPRKSRGAYMLSPQGRERSQSLVSGLDLAALVAETSENVLPDLGLTAHPTLPPWLAPPSLIAPLREFLREFPFDANVFGMTRFPDEQDASDPDPIAPALEIARKTCARHGLTFHLASDRKIVDDLWSNVDAHMWGCRYGIGFFEDRRSRGLNYNLTIEVGSMLATGRRLALLKDKSIKSMPTDLVGKIYMSVDLDAVSSVEGALHTWLRNDLRLGPCDACS